MPTGYTAPVLDGKITEFKDFAKMCARAFGALVELRDESLSSDIPTEFAANTTYYDEAIEKAKEKLRAYASRTEDDWRAEMEEENNKKFEVWKEGKLRQATERQRYEEMLSKVRAWFPPTNEHVGVKEFMIQQLEQSIQFDCSYDWPKPVLETDVSKFESEAFTHVAEDITYYTEQRNKEIERAESRNAWLKAFLESLD